MKHIFTNNKSEIWEFKSGNQIIQLEFSVDGYVLVRNNEASIVLDKEVIEFINLKTGGDRE